MEATLRTLFTYAMEAFADAQGLLIQMPNTDFDPPVSSDPNNDSENIYLKVAALPVAPAVIVVCGESRFRWVLQVSIVARDGIGEIRSSVYAGKLRKEAFPIHSVLADANYTFKVMTPPTPAQPIDGDDGWYEMPVSFVVETFD